MNPFELKEKIQNGEDSFTQFKLKVNDSKKLAEEMVAFSNAEGGMILLGVSNEGVLHGIDNREIDDLNQLISNAASQFVRPPIYPLTEILSIEDKKIVCIYIRKGKNKPYQTGGGLYFTKVGSDKRKMSPEELRRLFAESNSLYADEEVLSGTDLSDLNTQLLYQFLEKKDPDVFLELKNGLLDLKTLLRNLDILSEESITVAGNLLFGINPQKFSKSFYTDCVYFEGKDVSSDKFITKERVLGTIPEMYKNTMNFLRSTLRNMQDSQNFNTPGTREIPEESISELLINAFAHRDYFLQSSIKVFLFEDRLEIQSPGKLPNSLTVPKIKSGISIHRNPILNSYLQYLVPYSGLGSGIKRALQYKKDIEFINDTEKETFTCILQRKNHTTL